MYEKHDSTEKERPVCRSNLVQKTIEEHEEKLQEAMDEYEFFAIDKALNSCEKIDIDVKLRH